MMNLRLFLIFTLGLFNAGCTINSVRPLPAPGTPAANHAVIVYGVRVEGSWEYSGFRIDLAEYDMPAQNIAGNCFRFNRTEVEVSPRPGKAKYFAFDAPAGYYVYSPFNGARLTGNFYAFEAPPGQTVYLGNFVLGENHLVTLERDFDKARNGINSALPELEGKSSLSKVTIVKTPHPFLCTP